MAMNDIKTNLKIITIKTKRGCALLGKTKDISLEIIKKFLQKENVEFVIHDCHSKAQKQETIMKIAAKYRDIPIVIYNNSEKILRNIQIIRAFCHLLDNLDYSGSYSFVNSEGVYESFSVNSSYIFIGNENLMPKRNNFLDKPAELDYIDCFCTYVKCYDFNNADNCI